MQTLHEKARFVFRAARKPVLLVLVVAGLGNPTSGQGLLGKRYFSAGYEAALQSPNFFDVEWTHSYVSRSNHPFSDTWDFGTNVKFEWASGQTGIGTPVPVDFDFVGFDLSLTKHFRPTATLDPYARFGIGYVRGEAEANLGGGVFVRDTVNDTGIYWAAGIEYRLTEQSALLTQIRSGASLEDFDVEELAYSDLYYESIFVHWWTERWLSGFTIGSDFDDIEIALGGFVGFDW